MKRFLTIAALGDGTQASRLRKSNQSTTAGETPAYQRKSADTKLTIAAKAGVSYDVKFYNMKRFLTIAALGDGTQASRLRKSNQPTTAGETPAYQRKSADTKLTIAAKAGVSYDVKLYKGLYVIPEDPDFRLFNQTFGITLGYRL